MLFCALLNVGLVRTTISNQVWLFIEETEYNIARHLMGGKDLCRVFVIGFLFFK